MDTVSGVPETAWMLPGWMIESAAMNKSKSQVFCNPWHVRRSNAFVELLIEPLNVCADTEVLSIDDPSVQWSTVGKNAPAVFCQCLPPSHLLSQPSRRLIWIPMWDDVWCRDQTWWRGIPKHLRVLAFSNSVTEMAGRAELNILSVRHYKNPASFQGVRWENGLCLFYWNRTNLVAPQSLEMLCHSIGIRRLILLDAPDPGYPQFGSGGLRSLSKAVEMEVHERTQTQEEYFALWSKANLFLAPRLREGVGMAFLEALARGAGVIAVDNATMNEYIAHGENGMLISPRTRMPVIQRLALRLVRFASPYPRLRWRVSAMTSRTLARRDPPLHANVAWSSLASADWPRLGAEATLRQAAGFERWSRESNAIAKFVLDW